MEVDKAMEMKDYIPMISALTALVAVVIGPLITLRVSKRQVFAPMRQAWIYDFRKLISEFIACSAALHSFHNRNSFLTDSEKKEIYNRLVHLEAEISLYLNSKESDHIKLIELTSEMVDLTHKKDVSNKDIMVLSGECELKITKISRKIIQKEWNVVKDS